MPLIRSGKKTSTLRVNCSVKENQDILFVSGQDKLEAHIDKIQKLSIAEVTDKMARSDGFKNKISLKNAIKKLYPKRTINHVYYIQFSLII